MPGFNIIIRSQRCLILADAFIVGVDNNAPQLIYMRDKQRPFAFAGLWNRTMSEKSDEPEHSFAIITTPSNSLLAGLGYKRMPAILDNDWYNRWLNPLTPLGEVLSMLSPYPTVKMNAYPISPQISDANLNEKSLVIPIGKPFFEEGDGNENMDLRKHRKKSGSTGKQTLGERKN